MVTAPSEKRKPRIDIDRVIHTTPINLNENIMKKPKTSSKILAGFITTIIITLLGSPFIAIGIGIGYLIWK